MRDKWHLDLIFTVMLKEGARDLLVLHIGCGVDITKKHVIDGTRK